MEIYPSKKLNTKIKSKIKKRVYLARAKTKQLKSGKINLELKISLKVKC